MASICLYYDKELEQATFIPLWETPLWFLIREQIDLSKGVEVTDVQLAKGVIRMTLQEEDAGDSGHRHPGVQRQAFRSCANGRWSTPRASPPKWL